MVWKKVLLKEVLQDFESGARPKGGVKDIESGVPSIGGEHLNNRGGFDFSNLRYIPEEFYGKLSKGKIEKGDILIVKDGATTGKTSFVDSNFPYEKAAINEHVFLARVNEKIISKLLYYYLFSLEGQIELKKCVTGTAQGGINLSVLEKISVKYPELIEEQEAIILEIERQFTRLDGSINSLKDAQGRLKLYRKAVLKNAFEGEMTQNWRRTYNVSKDFSKTSFDDDVKSSEPLSFPVLPNGWEWLKIQNVGKVTGGLAKNSHRGKCTHNLPYLRVANVYAGYLLLDEIKSIGVNDCEIDKLLLKKGDLLIVEGNGSIDQIGRVAIWDDQVSPCIHQNHIIKIRFSDLDDSRFVLYWLLSPGGREQIRKVASSTSGLHTLSLSKVSGLPLPFPPKGERQIIVQEIERRLSVLEYVEKNLTNLFSRTNELRQSILKQAFEGRLVKNECKAI